MFYDFVFEEEFVVQYSVGFGFRLEVEIDINNWFVLVYF